MEVFKNKKIVYIFVSVCVFFICVFVCVINENSTRGNEQENVFFENNETENEIRAKEKEKSEIIIVHIIGEVNNPGVVEIKEGSRIKDVVESAGGFTNEANVDKVNLAYEVKDEQKIIIPSINKKDDDVSIIDGNEAFIEQGNTKSNLVNINSATQSELESLNGIGPSMASKIIEYRNKNGRFKSIEDIKNVPGIGNSKYEAIKDDITTN